MFERYCLLRSGAAFIMSISTLSVVAQDAGKSGAFVKGEFKK